MAVEAGQTSQRTRLMNDSNASLTHQIPWLSPEAIALDRTTRLRERISAGRYPLQPLLVAEAILACAEDHRVNALTPPGAAASKD